MREATNNQQNHARDNSQDKGLFHKQQVATTSLLFTGVPNVAWRWTLLTELRGHSSESASALIKFPTFQ